MCARNRKVSQSRWAAVRDTGRWAADKLRTGVVAIGLRGGALIALAVLALVGICLARAAVGRDRHYRVYPARFKVRAPAWCADALARITFPRDSYSIYDPALIRDVAEAYKSSPWVAAVRSVEKRLPNELTIRLELRQPVAFIQTGLAEASESSPPTEHRYAVDSRAVVLPLGYRAWDHRRHPVPTVYGVEGQPPEPGRSWRERHVAAALAVIQALAADPDVLDQIGMIDVSNLDGDANPRDSEIVLYTRKYGRRGIIRWGAPPNDSDTMEPSPSKKLAKLRRHLAHPLATDGASYLDLRFPDRDTVATSF